MKKFIHIGGDSRTGGSLIARLFDGHPGILSYPFENEFFTHRNYKLINFDDYLSSGDFADLEKEEVVLKIKKFGDDVLTSKQFYDEDSIEFNYDSFIRYLKDLVEGKKADDQEIYDAIHSAFFKEFIHSLDFENASGVCNHCSRTFLGDLDSFFSTFSNGYFLHTIRDAKSVSASMKNYSYVVTGKSSANLPDHFVEDVLNRWMLALYLGLKNKEKFGSKYILVSYRKLVKNPGSYLEKLCERLSIPFRQEMLTPKFGKTTWSGNSSFGKLPSKISSNTLYKFRDVLSKNEIDFINSEVGEIEDMFEDNNYGELNEAVSLKVKERLPQVLSLNHSDMRRYFKKIHKEMRDVQIQS